MSYLFIFVRLFVVHSDCKSYCNAKIIALLKHCNSNAKLITLINFFEKMTIQDRLSKYLAFKLLKAKDFERVCGLSNGTATRLRETSRQSTFNRIANNCDLNIDWLLTGEGEMLKDSSTNVGEVSGDGNIVGMTVTQTIGENSGQNAGRDINNYGERQFLAALEAQRALAQKQLEVYEASLDRKDEQLRAAQSQIDTLIHQNQEQFNRLLALIETLKS